MKKIFIFLIILLLPCMAYADSAVQDLTDISSPATGDDMYIVDDPDGTPASKKINIGALLAVANDLDASGDVTDDSHNHVTTNIDAATSVAWNAQVSDNTGSGLLVFNDSPTFVTPILGTIASGVGTALTALDGENIQNDTIDDDSIDLTDITLADFTNDSGYLTTVDISSDTNLSAGTNLTQVGDTLNVDTLTLSTHTDGNYVASITNGTGISGGDGGSEGAGLTLSATLGTAIDTSEITDATILEADLKVVDTPGDEQILTYESTTGDFEWHTGAELCEAITGGSTLCDGSDASGGAGTGTLSVRFDGDEVTSGATTIDFIEDTTPLSLSYSGSSVTVNFSTIDISSHTNLSADTNITLTGDTLSVDDAFVLTAGDVMTGALQVTTIEIGAATDTTLARSGAGLVTIEGSEVSLLGQSISVAELTQVGSPDSTKYLNGAGTWTTIAAGSGHTIQDEGGDLTARTNLNFVGAGVECTDDAGNDQTDCTISGGGTGSLDDGYNNSPTVLVDAGAVFFNSDSTTSGAFSIDGEQTTVDMVLFDGQALTTGDALQITVDSTAMTTGNAINIYDANATASIFTVDDVGATSIGQGSSGSIDFGTNTMTDSIVGNLLTDQIHLAAMSWNVSGTFKVGSPEIDHKGAHRLSLPADADSAAAYQVYIPNTFGDTPVLKGNISQTVTEAATDCGIEVDVKCTSPGQAEAFWLNSGFDSVNDPGGLTLGATLDYLVSFSISLTNNDSMTAGDTCMIRVNRDIDDDDGATGSCLFTDMILEWNR